MPTYAYRCSACGHEFDAVQSFQDDPLTLCPSCGEAAAKRVFRSVGVIFKGSGWYVTDTRGARGRRGGAAAGGEASDAPDAPADAPAKPAEKAAEAPAAQDAPSPAKPAEPAAP